MSAVWISIIGATIVTFAIKAFGPVAMGGRELTPRLATVVGLFAPALLAALVLTSTLADGDKLAIGEETGGVAAAGVALWRGASIVPVVVIAAVVTAALRAL